MTDNAETEARWLPIESAPKDGTPIRVLRRIKGLWAPVHRIQFVGNVWRFADTGETIGRLRDYKAQWAPAEDGSL